MPCIDGHLQITKIIRMIGNTTIHHLINDSLMPELKAYGDEKIFTKIWREWRSETKRTFIHPQKAFELAGLNYSKELKNDWDLLQKQSESIAEKAPLHLLFNFFPSQYRIRFFVAISWQSLHVQYHILFSKIRSEDSIQHQQYILMHYLMDLEQLMEDNDNKLNDTTDKCIRLSYRSLMSFFWLKLYTRYSDFLHLKSLRYFKDDLEFQLQSFNENTAKLQEYLADQLAEKPALSQEEFEKMAPTEIMAGLKDDLKEIQESMKHLGKPLEMDQDVYLKPKEVREEFGIAQSTLAKYRKEGKLKKFKFMFNRYEYSRKELMEVWGR